MPPINPRTVIVLLLAFFPLGARAQITGRVVDSAGTPLVGVSIAALHDGAQVLSLVNGSFSLELFDESVGALVVPGRAMSSMAGVRLLRNPETWQVEVHAQGEVYNSRGQFLRAGAGVGMRGHVASGEIALRKALLQPDTLVFVKAGYVERLVQITEDDQDLGDVVLASVSGVVYGSLTDARDGRVYRTVAIGSQVWMAENLDFGTRVAGIANQANATATSAEKYCYANNEAHCTTYGGFYQWHTVMALPFTCNNTEVGTPPCIVNTTQRGICPQGWHVPTKEEWAILDTWVDSANGGVFNDEGTSLKSTTLWSSGAGSDTYGWSGLPGGYRYSGQFSGQGNGGSWWSATQYTDATDAWYRPLASHLALLSEANNSKSVSGFSLRCLQDSL